MMQPYQSATTDDPLALECVELRYHYAVGSRADASAALRGVNLRVAAGEMVGLLGPNGAGKSTLIKVITGTLAAREGVARLWGDEVRRLPREEIARRAAVVPQDFTVQFAYTVRQVVGLGRMAHTGALHIPRKADHAAIAAALVATNLTDFADRVYNELSGGERQRVLVALALAQHARLILLDEPTAHLDIHHQIAVLELLRTLNREQGLTIVAALHDLNLAARFFPRLVLLDRTVIADGPPTTVLDAALISRVYATPVRVGILRGEAHLSVLPPGERAPDLTPSTPVAHIIAGGGAGELLMRALADAGLGFTAGPLNIGDSDQVLAERLGATCLLEPPFAPVSPAGLAAARELIRRSGRVIIAPIALGHGNVALLEIALMALHEGAAVWILLDADQADTTGEAREDAMQSALAARDFSGKGLAGYQALIAAGARIAAQPGEIVAALTLE